MKARVFLNLLTLPVLLLTSCERGYDLSFGEALTIYNDIATDIGKNNAASYKLGGYSYVGNSLALDIDYAVEEMYFHRREVRVIKEGEGEEALPSYDFEEYWFYVDEGTVYELTKTIVEGTFVYSASTYKEMTASDVYKKIREFGDEVYQEVRSSTLEALEDFLTVETTPGSSYAVFSTEAGSLSGTYSQMVGDFELRYHVVYGNYYPLSIKREFGDYKESETFYFGSYRRNIPEDLSLFPLPKGRV